MKPTNVNCPFQMGSVLMCQEGIKGEKPKVAKTKGKKQKSEQSEGGELYDPVYLFEVAFEIGLQHSRQLALQHLRQIPIHCVQKHFPVLAPLAEEQAAQVKDAEVLYKVIIAIIEAKEARCVLEEAHQGQ